MSILILLLAACATVPGQTAQAGYGAPRLAPGARCDFDDECSSGVCDDYACRG
jgi:hypothetical protein